MRKTEYLNRRKYMGLLDGKVCLITGTSRGIGAETARRFAQEGAVVCANAINEGSIDERSADWAKEYNTIVEPIYFDVTDGNAAKQAIMRIKKEHGRLDVLVNNAGVMRDALIGMVDTELMEEIFSVNVYAVINLLQLASRIMCRQHSGSIINLSSIVGVEGNAGQIVYSASKGAVAALTKTAAKELAPENIRVNAIAPGMIDTDMFRSIGDEKMEEHLKNIKMGRLGTPNDIANAIVFLGSDLSTYVTGQILGVDGEAMV
jgi:3-oxoacyl-[acyl-carrier protein] reductase